MEINYLTIMATVINFALLAAIIVAIYNGIRGFKKIINRSKDIDKKIDVIMEKLENIEDK